MGAEEHPRRHLTPLSLLAAREASREGGRPHPNLGRPRDLGRVCCLSNLWARSFFARSAPLPALSVAGFCLVHAFRVRAGKSLFFAAQILRSPPTDLPPKSSKTTHNVAPPSPPPSFYFSRNLRERRLRAPPPPPLPLHVLSQETFLWKSGGSVGVGGRGEVPPTVACEQAEADDTCTSSIQSPLRLSGCTSLTAPRLCEPFPESGSGPFPATDFMCRGMKSMGPDIRLGNTGVSSTHQ